MKPQRTLARATLLICAVLNGVIYGVIIWLIFWLATKVSARGKKEVVLAKPKK